MYARRFDGLPRLFERRFCAAERRLAAFDPCAQCPRVDLHEELAKRHPVAFVDREVDDSSGCIGADVDEPLRLNLAGRRHEGLEVAGADRLGGDHRRRGAARPPGVSAGRAERNQRDNRDDNLLVS